MLDRPLELVIGLAGGETAMAGDDVGVMGATTRCKV
jgi:hypothetical protein